MLVLSGNLLLFLVTVFSFILYRKALLAANTQAFLRNVYSGMLLKLFICMVAAFIYISAAGRSVKTGQQYSSNAVISSLMPPMPACA